MRISILNEDGRELVIDSEIPLKVGDEIAEEGSREVVKVTRAIYFVHNGQLAQRVNINEPYLPNWNAL